MQKHSWGTKHINWVLSYVQIYATLNIQSVHRMLMWCKQKSNESSEATVNIVILNFMYNSTRI